MGVLSDPRNGILRMKGSCPPRRRPTDESEAVETSTPEHITRIEGTWKDAPRVSSFAHRSHQILEATGGWKPLRRIDQNPLAVDTLRISHVRSSLVPSRCGNVATIDLKNTAYRSACLGVPRRTPVHSRCHPAFQLVLRTFRMHSNRVTENWVQRSDTPDELARTPSHPTAASLEVSWVERVAEHDRQSAKQQRPHCPACFMRNSCASTAQSSDERT